MYSDFSLVNEINPDKETWRVKVKVTRRWMVLSKDSNKNKCFLEMVLIDEQGDKIQATVPRYLIRRYENIVKEGVIYDLYNFRVEKPEGQFFATKHQYKITFHSNTEMRKSSHLLAIKRDAEFISFDDIVKQSNDEDKFLCDIISFVDHIYDVEPVKARGQMTNKMDVELKDKRLTRLKCTLWEGYYEQLLHYKRDHPNN
ncbi:hypothetical protein ACS0TY_033676 [Phlomoides rotata]